MSRSGAPTRRARLVAARNSSDAAERAAATSNAFRKAASASRALPARDEQLAVEAMELGLPETLGAIVKRGERFLKRGAAVIEPALTETGRGQFGQIETQKHAEAGGAVRVETPLQMLDAGIRRVISGGQRQAEKHIRIAHLEEPVLFGDCNHFLRVTADRLAVAPEAMEEAGEEEDCRERERLRRLSRPGERRIAALARLVMIAEQPQIERVVNAARLAVVRAERSREKLTEIGIALFQRGRQVSPRGLEIAKEKAHRAESVAALDAVDRAVPRVGQPAHLLAERQCPVRLGLNGIEAEQAVQQFKPSLLLAT